MGPIGCTQTSVRNYHYLLRNDPEERCSLPVCRFISERSTRWTMKYCQDVQSKLSWGMKTCYKLTYRTRINKARTFCLLNVSTTPTFRGPRYSNHHLLTSVSTFSEFKASHECISKPWPSSLAWDATQCRLTVSYRRFGPTYRSPSTLRNVSVERRSLLQGGGCLKSRISPNFFFNFAK
jgi:hypothetical protein